MNTDAPILIIEDDKDDRDILNDVFLELRYPNEIIFFNTGGKAYDYILNNIQKPFLIISDLNMPLMNGFELRDKICEHEEMRVRCVPYIFLTTSISPNHIIEAYSKSIQGFFVKPDTYQEMVALIKSIVEY